MYKRTSVALFRRFGEGKSFKKLHLQLQAAGIKILLKTYVSIMLFTSVLAAAGALAGVIVFSLFFQMNLLTILLFSITIPVFVGAATFTFFYLYPSQKAKSVKNSIENDLPFAMAHLSAISSSGIPPSAMFELLAGFEEYKEISRAASLIVRNIKTFGMSSVAAITTVAKTTPSRDFKQVLNGIAFNTEKGGDLTHYLKGASDKSLFEYTIKREKYLKTLSTYADIYTALIVAAPMMMLALLGILSVIGGEIIGLTITDLILVLTFGVLPFLNIAFLAFIHLTYPGG